MVDTEIVLDRYRLRVILWIHTRRNGMTPEEFTSKMVDIDLNGDTEVAHSDGDDLMCDLLRELGYEDGVKVFEAMDKWYA